MGQSVGKPLYFASCEVDQFLVGKRPMFNRSAKLNSASYSGEPHANKTCPTGLTIQDVTQGREEQQTSTFQNGGMVQRRSFWVHKTTITYSCTA